MTLQLRGRRWPPPPTTVEADAVASVLASGEWVDGQWTRAAEQELRRVTEAPHAILFNSCTSAIHAALGGLGCWQDTNLAVPAFGFAGTITGALHLGARLRFTDVDADTLNLTGISPAADLTLAVDTHGVPHGLDRASLRVLTDACQSLGSWLHGAPVGATGTHAWSFSPSKLIAAPDGGAITTDNAELAGLLRALRDYGLVPGEARANAGLVYAKGHNWRPSEVSACLVALRLPKVPQLAERARVVHDQLAYSLDQAGLWYQQPAPGSLPAWHKLRFGPPLRMPDETAALETALAAAGVPTHRWGVRPLHQHPVTVQATARSLPVAESAAAGTLCLGTEACPPHSWTDDEVDQVSRILETVTIPCQ